MRDKSSFEKEIFISPYEIDDFELENMIKANPFEEEIKISTHQDSLLMMNCCELSEIMFIKTKKWEVHFNWTKYNQSNLFIAIREVEKLHLIIPKEHDFEYSIDSLNMLNTQDSYYNDKNPTNITITCKAIKSLINNLKYEEFRLMPTDWNHFVWLDKNLSSKFFCIDNAWKFTKESMNIEIYSNIYEDFDGEMISDQLIEMELAYIKLFRINFHVKIDGTAINDLFSIIMKLKNTKRIEFINIPNEILISLASEIKINSAPKEVYIKSQEDRSMECVYAIQSLKSLFLKLKWLLIIE